MAKNKTGLLIGLAATGLIGYLLLKKPSATVTAPASAPGGTAPGAAGPTGWAALVPALINAGKSLFGGSTPAFAPVSVAPIAPGAPSPAGGINYINPTAPTLAITAPPVASGSSDTASVDLNAYDIFL